MIDPIKEFVKACAFTKGYSINMDNIANMKCRNCGIDIPEAKFCPYCGKSDEAVSNVPSGDTIVPDDIACDSIQIKRLNRAREIYDKIYESENSRLVRKGDAYYATDDVTINIDNARNLRVAGNINMVNDYANVILDVNGKNVRIRFCNHILIYRVEGENRIAIFADGEEVEFEAENILCKFLSRDPLYIFKVNRSFHVHSDYRKDGSISLNGNPIVNNKLCSVKINSTLLINGFVKLRIGSE